MEEKDKIKAGVKKMIRPLLIAAKGGVPLEKINRKNFSLIIQSIFDAKPKTKDENRIEIKIQGLSTPELNEVQIFCD